MNSSPEQEFDEWWDITHPDGTGDVDYVMEEDVDSTLEDLYDDREVDEV